MTRPRPTTHRASSRCTHPSKPTFSLSPSTTQLIRPLLSRAANHDSHSPPPDISPIDPILSDMANNAAGHADADADAEHSIPPHPTAHYFRGTILKPAFTRVYNAKPPHHALHRQKGMCVLDIVRGGGGGWRAGAAAREGRSTGPGPSRDPNRLVSGLSSRDTEAAAEKRLYVTVPSLPKREVMRHRSVLVTKVTVEGRNCILQVHGYGYIPPHDSRSNLTLQQITGTAKESTVSYSAFSQ